MQIYAFIGLNRICDCICYLSLNYAFKMTPENVKFTKNVNTVARTMQYLYYMNHHRVLRSGYINSWESLNFHV